MFVGIGAGLFIPKIWEILHQKGELNIMTLSKFEQETIITFNAEEKTAEIYTADPVQIRRLDSLCTEFPDTYKLKKQGEISKNYTVPKEYITFRKPRVISEQQRERLIENLKKARTGR
jgi:hypothetical protein